MAISIWYKPEHGKIEKVDTAPAGQAGYLVHEYQMAYGVLPGQHRHGKDKVWAGLKSDEPQHHN